MVVSDQEIDQLYAERYRLDQLFQNSPEFQDSLENSSAADSRSGISHRSQRSRRSKASPSHSKKSRHPPERMSVNNSDGHSPRGSPHRRKEGKGNNGNSPATSSPRWPKLTESPKAGSGRNTPRSEPSPTRRPQPPIQPGFSYIYPNSDANIPLDKKPIRRYSFLGNSNPGTDALLPFKGKLEYFDRLSRGSTPEPVTSPFAQVHRRGVSPHKVVPSSPRENKQQQVDSSPRLDATRRQMLLKLQSRSVELPPPPRTPLTPASHGSSSQMRGNLTSGSSSQILKDNVSGDSERHAPPPPQILFEDKSSRINRSPNNDKRAFYSNNPSPIHRRQSFLQLSDIEDRSTPSLTPRSHPKSMDRRDIRCEDKASDQSENISRMSSFAEIKRNERRSSQIHQELFEQSGIKIENRSPRNARALMEEKYQRDYGLPVERNERQSRNNREERRHREVERNERQNRNVLEEMSPRESRNRRESNSKDQRYQRSPRDERSRRDDRNFNLNFNVPAEFADDHKEKNVSKLNGGSYNKERSSNSKPGLQRHLSSPAIDVTRKGLSVGQSRISDSVAQITDSMSQLRRSLSKRVGRSVSRSISKSISRSFARKYKRQYNDEANDEQLEDPEPQNRHQRKRNLRPTLSDTFSTLRRSNAFNHAGMSYHALFGDGNAKEKSDRPSKDPKVLSDIHRYIHSQEIDGDSRSQRSFRSSSLPHPIDASVRDEVSLQEKHPEKFWTFTTSVVLPDYDPKPGDCPMFNFPRRLIDMDIDIGAY
ncbi:hypothetical protein SK128_021985 [Halocaridina rubra]|uniref:Uncharacterized protein n=1 Tax=Halocaridina rubra TaxID=373956 RepID=A0AAN8ZWC2_HALRR